ncbi:FtsX-like permease family protein [uncultured Sphaerochaeta sp.]|uniref:ABC transporter permease n=1 Tax=uncultured Sphaerochaeta sp. TaxID=886478 RepID=UPI002A0A601C|nr:FtsX-like permease family protein [uncultured Sphaerochaeta sp.]
MKRQLVLLLSARKLGIHGTKTAKRRIFFNILLITLVVSMLVLSQLFVVSMSNGIADKYALLGNGHLQVHEPPNTAIPALPSIYDKQNVSQTVALAYSATANKMVRVKGVGSTYFNEYRMKQMTLYKDKMEDDSSNLPRISISTSLATLLSVKRGDRIALMMVNGVESTSLRPQLCIIDTLYDSGYKELDENLIFCNYSLIEKLFGASTDTYFELLVDENAIETTKKTLQEAGLSVTSWDEENYSVATNLNTSKEAILGVLIIVAILCGYFISEVSSEMVEDDKHKIALLKLLGATDRVISKVYFSTVMAVTLVSIALGTLLGILLGINLNGVLSMLAKRSIPALSYYLLDFSVIVPIKEVLLIISVLAVVSGLSIFWSLRRIHKIELLSCTHFD